MAESKGIRNVMSRVDFFKVVECLKKNKQWFLDNRPTLPQAAEKLKELMGNPDYVIPYKSVSDMQEASGITWEAKRIITDRSGKVKELEDLLLQAMQTIEQQGRDLKCLARAVRTLYNKGREPYPETFNSLLNRYDAPTNNQVPIAVANH